MSTPGLQGAPAFKPLLQTSQIFNQTGIGTVRGQITLSRRQLRLTVLLLLLQGVNPLLQLPALLFTVGQLLLAGLLLLPQCGQFPVQFLHLPDQPGFLLQCLLRLLLVHLCCLPGGQCAGCCGRRKAMLLTCLRQRFLLTLAQLAGIA